MIRFFLISFLLLGFFGCVTPEFSNPYENSSVAEKENFLKVHIPFSSNTKFVLSQGAFGANSHREKGNEYSWDFDVPFGTDVVAVADGKVFDVWQPNKGGDCNSSYSNYAHNIKIEHKDGTVAQYVHINTSLAKGDEVKVGQKIAVTAKNGWIYSPQLHFGIYKSKDRLYTSKQRQTIPLYFIEIPGGVAKEGFARP